MAKELFTDGLVGRTAHCEDCNLGVWANCGDVQVATIKRRSTLDVGCALRCLRCIVAWTFVSACRRILACTHLRTVDVYDVSRFEAGVRPIGCEVDVLSPKLGGPCSAARYIISTRTCFLPRPLFPLCRMLGPLQYRRCSFRP